MNLQPAHLSCPVYQPSRYHSSRIIKVVHKHWNMILTSTVTGEQEPLDLCPTVYVRVCVCVCTFGTAGAIALNSQTLFVILDPDHASLLWTLRHWRALG